MITTSNTKIHERQIWSKNNILVATLIEIFGVKMNLARIKFFGLFIMALCKVQTACFEKLAASFESDSQVDSSLGRIQRYIGKAGIINQSLPILFG